MSALSTPARIAEHPAPFQAAMVRAIMRDVDPKTDTRRTKGLERINEIRDDVTFSHMCSDGVAAFDVKPDAVQRLGFGSILAKCPYGQVGDRLWVRETFASVRPGIIAYNADAQCGAYMGDGAGGRFWIHHGYVLESEAYHGAKEPIRTYGLKHYGGKWKPSIFMPRWASRLTLEITDIRPERLQDISEEDALAEGIVRIPLYHHPFKVPGTDIFAASAKEAFAGLWDSINGKKPGHSWADNPWVRAISFRRLEAAGR